jgi:hypothetical protein
LTTRTGFGHLEADIGKGEFLTIIGIAHHMTGAGRTTSPALHSCSTIFGAR